MLSQQEEAFHDKAAPNSSYETPSEIELRQDTLLRVPSISSGARPSQLYDPLKYCSSPTTITDALPDEDLGAMDSLERSLLAQTRLREQRQQIFERRYKLDALTADSFKDDAYS